uniref:Uncharacterized protein n=1 Tax=Oryza rufipogon TaxID=4529 RepID=A0A0E0QI65_ORYRU
MVCRTTDISSVTLPAVCRATFPLYLKVSWSTSCRSAKNCGRISQIYNMMRKISYIGRNGAQALLSPLLLQVAAISCLLRVMVKMLSFLRVTMNRQRLAVVLFAQFMLTDLDLSLRYVVFPV